MAVGPAQLVTSAYWTLRGASAFVAGKLGTTVTHVLQQHSMLHMTKVCKLNSISHRGCCTSGGLDQPTPQLQTSLHMRSVLPCSSPLLLNRLFVVISEHDTVSYSICNDVCLWIRMLLVFLMTSLDCVLGCLSSMSQLINVALLRRALMCCAVPRLLWAKYLLDA